MTKARDRRSLRVEESSFDSREGNRDTREGNREAISLVLSFQSHPSKAARLLGKDGSLCLRNVDLRLADRDGLCGRDGDSALE